VKEFTLPDDRPFATVGVETDVADAAVVDGKRTWLVERNAVEMA
jgi:hypothetical protein